MQKQGEFIDLLQPNLAALNRFVSGSVRNCFDADDIVQETVFKAFLHFNDFRGESKFKTWLMSIALNEMRSRHRAEARSRTSYFEPDQLDILSGASDRDSLFSDYHKSEAIQHLYGAISSLRPFDKEIVQLRGVKGLNLAETARQLSISISAVKSRYHRAVDRISRKLVRHCGEPIQGSIKGFAKPKPFRRGTRVAGQQGRLAA